MADVIAVYGAREHNLKSIDVKLPKDKLVVLTGLSGSGKSSLAFDTIYAEGQRRYVESLTSYARQFLGRLDKPDVDKIDGLSPAIAIDQKTTSKNPRSTVGTVTEIYDYLRLLYARVGIPHCPECGAAVVSQTVDQMVERIKSRPHGTRITVMAPLIKNRKGTFVKLFSELQQQGFVRVRVDGDSYLIENSIELEKNRKHTIEVIIDRLVLRDDINQRLTDSLETALRLADGVACVSLEMPSFGETGAESIIVEELFSEKTSCLSCGVSIPELTPQMFSFNSPLGACSHCHGLGNISEVDPDLVVVNAKLSLHEGAIRAPGFNFSDQSSWMHCHLVALAKMFNFSLDEPYDGLSDEIKQAILYGIGDKALKIDTSPSDYQREGIYTTTWGGVIPIINRRYMETTSDDAKTLYVQYMSISACPSCHGDRLNPFAAAVKIGGLSLPELTRRSIDLCQQHLCVQTWSSEQQAIVAPIMRELSSRLQFLIDVGLDYLTLARSAATLSGGEAQRIRLATQIGSGLSGVLYVLDEPSIGLHQRDNNRLLQTLKHLRDLGNTVLVVEHDEETIWEADYLIDIGPGAGEHGGELVACGTAEDIMAELKSLTGNYLAGIRKIPVPEGRKKPTKDGWLEIVGASCNNLKNIDVRLPIGLLVAVTGVSGSGKSSLINGVLRAKLAPSNTLRQKNTKVCDTILGTSMVDKVIAIDQSPIGRTPRSNSATYTGTFDLIRELFAATKEAKARGYKIGRFSFNVKGGRCEACSGDGVKCIEMHFLPDVYVPCEVCKGKRYNRETLEVRFHGKTIAEVLEMTVDNALEFFAPYPRLVRRLQTLQDVGLGYIRLGQPSTQLSGGEAQRVKLATELARMSKGQTMYVLDEPTTGLHTADVHRLIEILQRLTSNGHTVIVIEHNLDVIKSADYIIDMGPEGGDGGGTVVAIGTPEEVSKNAKSYTGKYLAQILKREFYDKK